MGKVEFSEKFASQGLNHYTPPSQFGAMRKSDIAGYAKIIKASNIKLEQSTRGWLAQMLGTLEKTG